MVNSSNSNLILARGIISCSIFEAAGPTIQDEAYKNAPKRKFLDRLPNWTYVRTSGGKLTGRGVRMILHANLDQYRIQDSIQDTLSSVYTYFKIRIFVISHF